MLSPAYYPSAILPAQAVMPAIAHYSAAAAVITAVPAIVTGIGEGYELIRAQYIQKGSWAKVWDDSWNMKDDGGKKVKMTVKHASMNDAVVGLAAFNWYVSIPCHSSLTSFTGPGDLCSGSVLPRNGRKGLTL